MYAIIEDGGRQYKVQEGQEIQVDYRDIPQGQTIQFDKVLAISDENGLRTGNPQVVGATVSAEVLGVGLDQKIYVQKLRRRKNSRRRTGHRQMHTKVRIARIGS